MSLKPDVTKNLTLSKMASSSYCIDPLFSSELFSIKFALKVDFNFVSFLPVSFLLS
jgi:hypothetical protein